jgi:hypothetical protein
VSFQATHYRDATGREPVKAFINALDGAAQESIDWMIGLLNGLTEKNPELGHPYTSALKGADYREFRELRVHGGGTRYWIIFRRSRNLFILLHMAPHRTGKIPEADKLIAAKRWDDYVRRMDAPVRVPPRAVGHDAP